MYMQYYIWPPYFITKKLNQCSPVGWEEGEWQHAASDQE